MNTLVSELRPEALAVLFLFRRKNRVSRREISEEIGLGEGSVKRILSNLKSLGLLDSSNKGHFLTDTGRSLLQKLLEKIEPVSPEELTEVPKLAKEFVAILIRDPREIAVHIVRDASIRAGASGALIFKRKGERVFLPPGDNDRHEYSKLKRIMEDGDVLIISFSDDRRHSWLGAIEMTYLLSESLSRD
ncbi:hypothetical protein DRN52_06595 [Thermococci archaeon]|nr:MAG: hypothetical protein DRN52_06595 [Thermococci archaeon]